MTDLSSLVKPAVVLPRITDRFCELVEQVTPGVVVRLAVPAADRLEYDVVLGMVQSPVGPQLVVQVMFTLPSPVLGEQLWSASMVPLAALPGDRFEESLRAVVTEALQSLVNAYNDKLAGR